MLTRSLCIFTNSHTKLEVMWAVIQPNLQKNRYTLWQIHQISNVPISFSSGHKILVQVLSDKKALWKQTVLNIIYLSMIWLLMLITKHTMPCENIQMISYCNLIRIIMSFIAKYVYTYEEFVLHWQNDSDKTQMIKIHNIQK